MFPLVTALPSTRSAAQLGALFAGFCGTMLVSDCSGPCITGVEVGSSRCGPRRHRVASPELSQFPRKECTRMLRLSDRAEPEKHSRWRAPRCCLPPAHQRQRSGLTAFAAQYPAYISPYRLLVCLLTETSARLGADVVRSTFIVVGIELGRTHLRWRVSSPALSIAGWVHNSTIAMFPKAPRVIPDGGLSPVRLATMAVPWQPSRHRGGSSARPHPPLTTRFTPRLVDALPLSTLLRLSVR